LWRRRLLLVKDLCLPEGKQRGLIGRNFFTRIYRQSSIQNLLPRIDNQGVTMFLELALPIALILLGLTRSTENILDLRQHQRDQGNDTKTYL
jgi:hypothetical protein